MTRQHTKVAKHRNKDSQSELSISSMVIKKTEKKKQKEGYKNSRYKNDKPSSSLMLHNPQTVRIFIKKIIVYLKKMLSN